MKPALTLYSLCLLFFVSFASADEGNPYLRITRDKAGELLAMETSIATYKGQVNGKEISVDLISAVHVGEKQYYEHLNTEFKKYDALLYELIAPEEMAVPGKGEHSENIISKFQGSIKNMLGLEFQLEEVDYTKKNFVHADLSPSAFMDSLAARGDSIWTLLGRVLLQSYNEGKSNPNPLDDWKFIMALISNDDTQRAFKMRRYLAKNFGKLNEVVSQIEGPNGSAIVADRNAKAIDVLKEQVEKGKTHLGVFYGGAHMPDMEKRLLEAYPLKPAGNRWILAWALQPQVKESAGL